MTESESIKDLEFVLDRLLELKEWESSKKIERVKNFIMGLDFELGVEAETIE